MKNKLYRSRRGNTTVIVISILFVGIAVGVIYFLNRNQESSRMDEMKKEVMKSQDDAMKKDDTMVKDGTMMKDDTSMVKNEESMMKPQGAVLAGKSSPLLEFKKADYEAALKTDKLVVVYFYADWCPFCKVEFPIMQQVFNGIAHDKFIGFRVHYGDSSVGADERALAREFGVGYQHTKVFLKDGKRVLKSPETWTKDRYMKELGVYAQ